MSASISLVVVEGYLEEPAARRLLDTSGISYNESNILVMRGSSTFWANAPRYNRASQHLGYILGLTDLDDNECPSGLITEHLGKELHQNFLLRVQVRELESWLLADAAGLSRFLSVSEGLMPPRPDELPDPKQALVNIARRSQKSRIVTELVPEVGRRGLVGTGYTATISDFILNHWNPNRAAKRSPSLARALAALKRIKSVA